MSLGSGVSLFSVNTKKVCLSLGHYIGSVATKNKWRGGGCLQAANFLSMDLKNCRFGLRCLINFSSFLFFSFTKKYDFAFCQFIS